MIPPPTGTLELATSSPAAGAGAAVAPRVAIKKPFEILILTFSRPEVAGPEIRAPVLALNTLLSPGQVILPARTFAAVSLASSLGQLAIKPENFLADRLKTRTLEVETENSFAVPFLSWVIRPRFTSFPKAGGPAKIRPMSARAPPSSDLLGIAISLRLYRALLAKAWASLAEGVSSVP